MLLSMIEKFFDKKREYYFNRVPQRDVIKTYDEIKTYRAENCKDDIFP
jgi:hypothetical protein